MIKSASHSEIQEALRCFLGLDWYDYFDSPFVASLFPHTNGFNVLSHLKMKGATCKELSNHPKYGLWANLKPSSEPCVESFRIFWVMVEDFIDLPHNHPEFEPRAKAAKLYQDRYMRQKRKEILAGKPVL